MLLKRIPDATRVLNGPQDWDESRGPVQGLPIRDVLDDAGGNWMASSWEPTPDELASLLDGGSVVLMVAGTGHPVVSLQVIKF